VWRSAPLGSGIRLGGSKLYSICADHGKRAPARTITLRIAGIQNFVNFFSFFDNVVIVLLQLLLVQNGPNVQHVQTFFAFRNIPSIYSIDICSPTTNAKLYSVRSQSIRVEYLHVALPFKFPHVSDALRVIRYATNRLEFGSVSVLQYILIGVQTFYTTILMCTYLSKFDDFYVVLMLFRGISK
jgi:hypothetical protein